MDIIFFNFYFFAKNINIIEIDFFFTHRVKGYTRFVGKYVTDRRYRFRLFVGKTTNMPPLYLYLITHE